MTSSSSTGSSSSASSSSSTKPSLPRPLVPLVPFEYALLRAVPRVERGEFVNVGVVLYCQKLDFLGVSAHIDGTKIRTLYPSADVPGIEAVLRGVSLVCDGGECAGQAGADAPGRRFRWLIAPRSTVVQPGPVHTGMTSDPAAELLRLVDSLVR